MKKKKKHKTKNILRDIHWYLCLIISPSITISIYSLSLPLSLLHCCLLPLLNHHTFNISPWQQASNFLLIAIRFMSDLSIKWYPGSLFLHRQTMIARESVEVCSSSVSRCFSNFCCFFYSTHMLKDMFFTLYLIQTHIYTTANTHKHCTNLALQHTVTQVYCSQYISYVWLLCV